MRKKQEAKRRFAEELGLFVEKMGLPPMAGRIWGWLLVCDPPHQTAAELAEAVGASLGAISTMMRLLMQFGLVERIGLPEQRSRSYRLTSGGCTHLVKARIRQIAEFRAMAERGLELLKGEPAAVRRRLKEYRDFYAFFEKEFPALVTKWEKAGKGTMS